MRLLRLRKETVHGLRDLFQAGLAILVGTGNDDPEEAAVENCYAAEAENAVFPDGFERIAEGVYFALGVVFPVLKTNAAWALSKQ